MSDIKKKILVIDKDLAVCRLICENMQNKFTDVRYMMSITEALASYMTESYCLVILDVQISDMNSIKTLQTIRNAKCVPILALTGHLSSDEKAFLYCAGAYAHIEKPLNMDICVAQANTLMHLYIDADFDQNLWAPVIHRGGLIISPHCRQVLLEGKSLALTRKEFDLLYFLASYPRQVFSRQQLYSHVWENDSILAVDETVKSHIKTLRKKLGSVGKSYIQNIWGVGYKFVLPDEK